MLGLNDIILKKKKVRNGIFAYETQGGINIDGYSYYGYSLTEAINRYRQQYPAYKKNQIYQ